MHARAASLIDLELCAHISIYCLYMHALTGSLICIYIYTYTYIDICLYVYTYIYIYMYGFGFRV